MNILQPWIVWPWCPWITNLCAHLDSFSDVALGIEVGKAALSSEEDEIGGFSFYSSSILEDAIVKPITTVRKVVVMQSCVPLCFFFNLEIARWFNSYGSTCSHEWRELGIYSFFMHMFCWSCYVVSVRMWNAHVENERAGINSCHDPTWIFCEPGYEPQSRPHSHSNRQQHLRYSSPRWSSVSSSKDSIRCSGQSKPCCRCSFCSC